jgi:hypothetical protein
MLYPSTHVVLLVFGGQRLDAFGWTVLPKSASYFDLLKKENYISQGRSYLRLYSSAAQNSCEASVLVPMTPEAKELEEVLSAKAESGHLLVAQTSPSVRVAFSEEFGLEPAVFSPEILVASSKALGFDLVLDTNTAADLKDPKCPIDLYFAKKPVRCLTRFDHSHQGEWTPGLGIEAR